MSARDQYVYHFRLVAGAVSTLNIPSVDTDMDPLAVDRLLEGHSIAELLGLPIGKFLHLYKLLGDGEVKFTVGIREQEPQRSAQGTEFRTDDLNTKSLRSIGGLEFVWTTEHSRHLTVKLSERKTYVCWFSFPAWTSSHE